MHWHIQFYHERSRTLAHYDVEAPGPSEALIVARHALSAEHPPTRARRAGSLFEHARRVGGHDADGWVLYRIAKESGAPKGEPV